MYYNMSSTNFLNSKQRRIFESDKGSFFVRTSAGKKSYGPVASFRKAGGEGAVRKLVAANSVPKKIAGAVSSGRKVRKNAGVARKNFSPGAMMARLMNKTYAAPKAKAGARPARARAVRKNAGVARGMRSPNQGVQYRMIFKTPPRRKSPKGKAMIGSPGGTVYRSAANMKRRSAAARKKRALNANPFSMLANMRLRGARQ
jgi:hypothetical protein